MAESKLTARVTTEGAEKADKELKNLGTTASKTEKKVDDMGKEFDTAGNKATKVGKKLKDSGKSARKAGNDFKSVGTNAAAAIALVDGPFGGVSSRVTAFTSVLTKGTLAVTALGVSVAALGFAVVAGIRQLDEYNVNMARTEAILKATGNAAGVTAMELQEQAQALAFATLTSVDQVQKAQAILLTFNKVTTDAFTDTIKLSQDLAEGGIGSITSNALTLGKALQDPLEGLSSLNRVGLKLSSSQDALARNFAKTGQTAKAQQIIIEALKKQVGGAGARVAEDSLAGKFDTAGQSWDNFTVALVENRGVLGVVGSGVDALSSSLTGLSEALGGGGLTRQVELNNEELAKQKKIMDDSTAALKEQEEQYKSNNFITNAYNAFTSAAAGSTYDLRIATALYNKALERQAELQPLVAEEEAKRLKARKDSAALQLKNEEEATAKRLDTELMALVERESAEEDAARKRLEFLGTINNTELENIQALQQSRMKLLQADRDALNISEKEFQDAQKEIIDNAENEKFKIISASEDKKTKKKADAAKDQAKLEQQSLDNSVALIGVFGGEQSKGMKAALLTSQLYAQKELVINEAKAVGMAWASAPFPANLPAVGAALLAFAPLAATVASAREQGGDLSAGQATTIAERDQLEVFIPKSAGTVKTAQQLGMGNAANSSPVNNFYITGYNDAQVTEKNNDTGGTDVYITREEANDLVVAQMGNPSSEGSMAMQAEFNMGRR